MKTKRIISTTILITLLTNTYSQVSNKLIRTDSLFHKAAVLFPIDSLKKIGEGVSKNLQRDSVKKQAHQIYYGQSNTSFHNVWEDGRTPEFSNAYTLPRHELRLSILGRSAFALTNKLELSTYLPLLITPNANLKYRFVDKSKWAMAAEVGVFAGVLPAAVATGLVFPGVAMVGGTAGFIHGSDKHIKLYTTWHPVNKLSFTAKGSVSYLKIGYTGLAAIGVVGGNGAVAFVLPVNGSLRSKYYTAGFEADYIINKKNVLVLNTSIGEFENGRTQLITNTLGWTHAKNAHLYYTVGLYNFIDPPSYETWKAEKSRMPVGVYANVYWILNNRITN